MLRGCPVSEFVSYQAPEGGKPETACGDSPAGLGSLCGLSRGDLPRHRTSVFCSVNWGREGMCGSRRPLPTFRIPGLRTDCRSSSRDTAFRGAAGAGRDGAERAAGTRAIRPWGILVASFVAMSWGQAQRRQAFGNCLRKKEAKSSDPRSADPGVEAIERFV